MTVHPPKTRDSELCERPPEPWKQFTVEAGGTDFGTHTLSTGRLTRHDVVENCLHVTTTTSHGLLP